MRASRRRACSSDSRLRMPPPSPHTKPSRPASNGREAFWGSSLRVDMAFIEQNPAMVSGTMMASAPPAIITSASPRSMRRMASPSAWLPVAQAVTTAEFGPLAPNRIEISPEAMFTISIGMKNGDTRSGPLALRTSWESSSVVIPPMPEPTRTPKRVPSIWSTFRSASSTAITAPAMAYFRYGSSLRSSFLSMYLSGSKPLSSPAMRVAKPLASNRVIGPMPETPLTSAAQNSSAVLPIGVRAPRPVMTTRRLFTRSAPLLVFLDVGDRIPHGGDLLGILVGNLEVEFLLERHHELHGVQRVRSQILDELRVGVDLVLLDPELLADDLLHPLLDRLRHRTPPRPRMSPPNAPAAYGGPSCLHVETTVHVDHLPRHVCGSVTRQESHDRRHLARLSGAAERDLRDQRVTRLVRQRGRHVGLDQPRRHCIDQDAPVR